MKFLRTIICLSILVFAPLSVRACPLCADAIASANANSSEEEIDHFPAAMNQSIYLMLGVPYSVLGIVGFCIYRGVKQNEVYKKSQEPEFDM